MGPIKNGRNRDQKCRAGKQSCHGAQSGKKASGGSRVPDREGNFSPTDLVAVALGSCVLAGVEAGLRRNGLDPLDFEMKVRKEMTGSPRRIAGLTLEVSKPSVLKEDVRDLLGKALDFCPVKRSLSDEIHVRLILP